MVYYSTFSHDLNTKSRTLVNAAAGGPLMSKTPDQVRQLLDEMASNNYDWPDERQVPVKSADKYSVDPVLALYSNCGLEYANIRANYK